MIQPTCVVCSFKKFQQVELEPPKKWDLTAVELVGGVSESESDRHKMGLSYGYGPIKLGNQRRDH